MTNNVSLLTYLYEQSSHWGAWSVFLGLCFYTMAFPFVHLIKEKDDSDLVLNQEFDFIIWPAIVTQAFFNTFWGNVGHGFLGVLTWRSFFMTLTFSVVINIFCIIMILNNVSENTPEFDLRLINILFKSELVFITCNFLGDLLSVHVTRFLLDKIIKAEIKSFKYVFYDFAGILGGYFIMILPSFFVLFLGDTFFEQPNEMIQAGLFGNILMPFFLSIFAVSYFPSLLSFFALFSVFSITIPTGIYLFFIVFINLAYRFYKQYLVEKRGMLLRVSKFISRTGENLSILGSGLMAIQTIL